MFIAEVRVFSARMVKVGFVKLRVVPCADFPVLLPPCLLQYNAIQINKSMARGCRLSRIDSELWMAWDHGC